METTVENSDALEQQWIEEQLRLRRQCLLKDPPELLAKLADSSLLVGGLDISYSPTDPSLAFVGVSVVRIGDPTTGKLPQTLVVECSQIEVNVPYIPDFLAFREVPAYLAAVSEFESLHSDLRADVFMVDSNGTLHPRRFGAACHLGVLLKRPCFGVAKKLPLLEALPNKLPRDADGRAQKCVIFERASRLNRGEVLNLLGQGGVLAGAALLTGTSCKPVFVSPGHLITLQTAVQITTRCSIHRIPEPTRQVLRRSYFSL
ncbi:unnamed protein product [Mesocestoides corti]|uniref:Endonuclease V n=2 Tax=Mesocestoides corti TaxID=53468 RepID=A0A158QVY3_MESCO|nr:unnamed protein product [Mesocestoides corti]